jgi:two-component system sensor histidine kinase PilS (NtrC family)
MSSWGGLSSPGGLSFTARATFWRSLQTLNFTRIVIAGVLFVYMVFGAKPGEGILSRALGELCGLYLVLAVAFTLAALRWQRRFLLQLSVQIAIDIVIISLLYQDAGGVRSGLAILYLFPLAGAAILAPLLLALFSAALVTLFMLAESTWQIFMLEGDRATVQAGLYGAAFFAMVLVLSRFAARLIGQEELAAQRGNALAIQQAINRLVIADMGDGIIVVDRGGEVFTGNPAASRMLGLAGFLAGFDAGFRLGDTPALQPIALAYRDWLADPARRSAFVTVKPYNDASLQGVTAAWSRRRDLAAHLKVRFATVDTAGLAAERYVIFLQDVTAIENQAQQLKLASMGRLTASIAHEVRNPLSAIGHATALLGEDLDRPVHLRLLKIVGDNVARVNRMVEDILQLSRKVQVQEEPLPLAAFLAELKTEFQETHALAADIIRIDPDGAATVRFDPLHLREIVLNLLNNAVRYASKQPGSIHLFLIADRAGRLELHVQDDGPGISPEVRAHLFEPFYTTSSKGTGLGLYLARELCLNNGALLDYEYRFDAGADAADSDADRQPSGRFVITFARQV